MRSLRLRTVGVAGLGGDVLVRRGLPGGALVGWQAVLLAGQRTRHFDAHRPPRVGQQGPGHAGALGLGQGGRRLGRGKAQQRLHIAGRLPRGGDVFTSAGTGQPVQRRGTGDRGLAGVAGQGRQTGLGVGAAGVGGMKGRGKALETGAISPQPAPQCVGRPLRRLALVAAVAGVGRAERDAQVRSGHPHAVVGPTVDHHEVGLGHVAVGARGAGAAGRVAMVAGAVVLARRMALRAHRIAVSTQFLGVRVVAIAAGHALAVHLALQPRTPHEDFVALLAVGVVQARCQHRRQVVVEKRLAGLVALGDLGATGVAPGADLDLAVGAAAPAAHRVAGIGVDAPGHTAALVQRCGQALGRVGSLVLGPGSMGRSRTVARLAAD